MFNSFKYFARAENLIIFKTNHKFSYKVQKISFNLFFSFLIHPDFSVEQETRLRNLVSTPKLHVFCLLPSNNNPVEDQINKNFLF